MGKAEKKQSARLLALDYLRGFFIVVIIIDHLYRFPNVFTLLSGEARLWMTAAEGFIMISGLLIGYIRGYKGLKHSFSTIARTLFQRSLLLYIWMIIGSIVYLGVASWILNIPGTPSAAVPVGDWGALVWNIITMQHPAVWVHFLYLYAIFLFLSIGAVWLYRTHKTWLIPAIAVPVYIIGWAYNIEWMKWQLLFFGAATVGFYLESIRTWWRSITQRRLLEWLLYGITFITLTLSIISGFFPQLLSSSLAETLSTVFFIDTFGPARVVISAVWFTALCLVFERIYPLLKKFTYGILEYFGTHSLTAYIAHGAVICLVNAFIPRGDSVVINSLVVFAGIMAVYGLIRIPFVRNILPR